MAFDDLLKQVFKNQFGDAVQSEISVGVLEKSFDLLLLGTHSLVEKSKDATQLCI